MRHPVYDYVVRSLESLYYENHYNFSREYVSLLHAQIQIILRSPKVTSGMSKALRADDGNTIVKHQNNSVLVLIAAGQLEITRRVYLVSGAP